MKKIIPILLLAFVAFAFSGCDGLLHNQASAYITLTVKNLPAPDGEYSWVGGFADNSWKNDQRKFRITGGNGSYTVGTDSMITSATFLFSVVPVGDWNRPWYPATSSNYSDNGLKHNIELTVPMDGQTHEIIIDGSSDPLVFTVN